MRIKNWKKFQHFKDRTPPWIKLHRCLLDDPDYHALDAYDAKYLTLLWLLASEDESKLGTLPSVGKIAFRLRISTEKAKSLINRLSHWLIQDDITPISERYQLGSPEAEAEAEAEAETETETQEKTEGEAPKTKKGLGEWKFNEEHRALAQQLGVNVEAEETIFRDYIASHGKRYSNYDAAFRNWLKNSLKFNGGTNGAETDRERRKRESREALDKLKAFGEGRGDGDFCPPTIRLLPPTGTGGES